MARETGKHRPTLTTRQETFAKHVAEGIYTNTESARKAGYAYRLSSKQATVLLNGRDFPHVVERVKELRRKESGDMVSPSWVSLNGSQSYLVGQKMMDNILQQSTLRKLDQLWGV